MTNRRSSQVPQPPTAVREVDENMRAVLDCAAFWVFVLDRNGQVGFLNRTAQQESGYQDYEILGNRRLWDLLFPDPGLRASVIARSRAVIDQGDAVDDYETPVRTRSGKTKIIAWSSRRVVGTEGENLGLIAIGRDVTEHQAHRERHLDHTERLGR